MIDMEFYAWREFALIDGEPRFLVPHADPQFHDYPCDGIFETVEQAEEFAEDWADSPEEAEGWVLIKYTGEIIRPGNFEATQKEMFERATRALVDIPEDEPYERG